MNWFKIAVNVKVDVLLLEVDVHELLLFKTTFFSTLLPLDDKETTTTTNTTAPAI